MFSRASYRVTQYNGLANEYKYTLKSGSIEQENCTKEVWKFCSLDEFNESQKIKLNPLLTEDAQNNYIIHAKLDTKKKVLRSFFVEYIVKLLENPCEFHSLKMKLRSQFVNLDLSEVEEALKTLIEHEFLVFDRTIRTDTGKKFLHCMPNKDAMDISNIINKKDLERTESFIRNLLGAVIYENYYEAVEEFYDTYNDKFISLKTLMENEQLVSKILSVKTSINKNSDLINNIHSQVEILKTVSGKDVIIDKKLIKRNYQKNHLAENRGFDIFFNLYKMNTDNVVIDIDTGQGIVPESDSHCIFNHDEKSDVLLGNNFNDEILAFLKFKNTEKNSKTIENSNIFDSIFIGLRENHFVVIDENKNDLHISKGTTIDLKFFPTPYIVLLICSSVSNLSVNFNDILSTSELFFHPRVMLDNIIVRRKTWNLSMLLNTTINYEEFYHNIVLLKEKRLINDILSMCSGDCETYLNLSSEDDLKYMYKSLKSNSKILFKENLQEYSPFFFNNDCYSNQCIASFHGKKRKETLNINKENIDVVVDNKHTNLEVDFYTINIQYNNNVTTSEIYDCIKMVIETFFIDEFFWVNYKIKENKNECRFRIKKDCEGIVSLILSKLGIENVSILVETYVPEYFRYYCLGIDNFFKLCNLDSKITIYEYNPDSTIKDTMINTNTWLKAFVEKDLNSEIAILKLLIKSHRVYKLGKEYTTFTNQFNKNKYKELSTFISSNYLYNLKKEEIAALIHMSNNRVLGPDIETEQKIYKLLLSYKLECKHREGKH
ncbi:lantibiotic dehydratase C-terminal domain-containing protein [Candidatus Enterococcus lemimoniae]|uniref:Lantibiotic dehydratase N-terminal domain-containing protein n=1 Tax=Candidatus Enterococcus lemimoniae TaxID=1834167 RepID=A0ABZ2T7W2_9ENTE